MNLDKYTQNAQGAIIDCQNIAIEEGWRLVLWRVLSRFLAFWFSIRISSFSPVSVRPFRISHPLHISSFSPNQFCHHARLLRTFSDVVSEIVAIGRNSCHDAGVSVKTLAS